LTSACAVSRYDVNVPSSGLSMDVRSFVRLVGRRWVDNIARLGTNPPQILESYVIAVDVDFFCFYKLVTDASALYDVDDAGKLHPKQFSTSLCVLLRPPVRQ